MAIELDMPGPGGNFTPKVSFPEVGDSVIFGIVDMQVQEQRDFRTGEVKISDYNNKPKTEMVITVIVKEPGAKTSAGKDETGELMYRPLEVGEVAELIYRGHNRYDPDQKDHKTWGAATDALRDAGQKVQVGFVGRAVFERTMAGQGSVPKKIIQTTLRAANPDERAFVDQCEAAYYAKQAKPAIELGDIGMSPAYNPTPQSFGDDAF